MYRRVARRALNIQFFRHFCYRMYRSTVVLVQPQHRAKNGTADISTSEIAIGKNYNFYNSWPWGAWSRDHGYSRRVYICGSFLQLRSALQATDRLLVSDSS